MVSVLKKVFGILILVCYAFCAFNISLSFHHCGGELAYVSVNNDDDHEVKCCDSKKPMPPDCCKSKKVTFSKTDDKAQAYYTLDLQKMQTDVALPVYHTYYVADVQPATGTKAKQLLRPPPERTGIPLYQLHSVYRI